MEKEIKAIGTKEITIEEAKEIATEIFQKYIVENNLSYDSVTILNMCLRQNIGNSTIVEMKY